jgi:3-deoxy-D-manno-octulosonic-acid transferase
LSLFTILYYILASILYIFSTPLLILLCFKSKYRQSIPSRYFLKNNSPFKQDSIWFHTCSMGETKAIKPIIDEFKNENININISVVTNTGFNEALKYSSNVKFLPYEIFLPFWIKKQKILIVLEAELWYMLFLYAKIKKTKTILINARISDNSYSSYKKFSWFYKYIFNKIDKIYSQSIEDKKRLESIGAKNIEVIGNIKLTQLPKINKILEKTDDFFITAASTHKKEEKLILESYDKKYGKLIIVPRHKERFNSVDSIIKNFIKNKNISYHRYSKQNNFKSNIVLFDTIGELSNLFAISDAVILGGAFEKIGGHNPIEPAFFNCRIISGEYYFNQKSLFDCVINYKIVKKEDLRNIMKNIKDIEKSKLTKIGNIDKIVSEIKKVTNE